MKREYLELVPDWYNTDKELDLVLSDDIDSLASCAVLNKVKGWKIKYFYDFEKIYASKELKQRRNERCFVDIAIHKGKAFDNHVSRLSIWDEWNTDMINLNMQSWVSNENYTDKYAGSTLLTVWSLYDLPLPKTEKGMMILLAIDSTFKGFYSDRFHDIQKHYLVDVLGFDELYRVIKRHNIDEFYDLIANYGLNAEIKFKNGKLITKLPLKELERLLDLDLDLDIPNKEFIVWQELEIVEEKIKDYHTTTDTLNTNIKTLALTYRSAVRYSKVKVKGEKKNEEKPDCIQWIYGKRTAS